MEYFTADFLQFFTKKRQNWFWMDGWVLNMYPSISGIFLSRWATREATRTFTFW